MALVFLMMGSYGVIGQTAGTTKRAERPAAIWASGPLEVIAAFAEPVEPDRAKALIGQSIPFFDLIEPNKGLAHADRAVGALRIVGVIEEPHVSP